MAMYRYFARYPADGPHPEEEHEFTREETLNRVNGWQKQPKLFVQCLERNPGEEHRGTPFAWYRAERVEPEPCIHCGAPILNGRGHDPGCSCGGE